MLTLREAKDILTDVHYLGWRFELNPHPDPQGSTWLLVIRFNDVNGEAWSSRKWFISQYATRSELVQTALKAVLTAVEHEARESFLYKGYPIFNPHNDIEELLTVAQEKRHGDGLSGILGRPIGMGH